MTIRADEKAFVKQLRQRLPCLCQEDRDASADMIERLVAERHTARGEGRRAGLAEAAEVTQGYLAATPAHDGDAAFLDGRKAAATEITAAIRALAAPVCVS